MTQLALPLGPEPVVAWQTLDRDEQHFLCYLGTHDGCAVPPRLVALKAVVERLKTKGLVCDSLVTAKAVELTPLAEQVMHDGFEAQRNSGHLFICRR